MITLCLDNPFPVHIVETPPTNHGACRGRKHVFGIVDLLDSPSYISNMFHHPGNMIVKHNWNMLNHNIVDNNITSVHANISSTIPILPSVESFPHCYIIWFR